MFMQPLRSEQKWTTFILSNLLESWSESRMSGAAPLPALIELAPKLGISSLSAAAFGSVFELAEACLGRPLQVERCCSDSLHADERALIRMLQTASAERSPAAFAEASSELADALALAAKSAALLLAPQEHELERLWNTLHAARLSH